MLRYPGDFLSQDPLGPHDPAQPLLSESLFYDDVRHVLELRPEPLPEEVKPLPGLAVDVNGEVYRAGRKPARVIVRRCDGSEEPLVCEPHVFAGPRGMALDRRGYLYVADARAHRVVVILPDDGSVRDILNTNVFREPVDVAVSPDGCICVADRGGSDAEGKRLAGKIAIYSSRHRLVRTFSPQNAEGLPEAPRPIAVMVDAERTLLVADASHPRLLRFALDGTPLPDVDLISLTRQLESGEVALEALEKAYGRKLPKFLRGMCCPPRPKLDGGERLAEVHRALRLLALQLGRRFETEGVFHSASLDSGAPGTQWHRVEVDADLPEGASLTVETATADDLAGLDITTIPAESWSSPTDSEGNIIPITPDLAEHLVQSRPGRFLRLRVRLSGDGTATPRLCAIRVLYPRVSYLDLLPPLYRRDPEGERFLEHFLALFELIFTRVEDRYEEFSRELNPDAAPREVIDWLGRVNTNLQKLLYSDVWRSPSSNTAASSRSCRASAAM